MNRYAVLKYITLFLSLGLSTPALAYCYKITAVDNNPASVLYTEPGKGTVNNWGAHMMALALWEQYLK